jgi:hypothetical protein
MACQEGMRSESSEPLAARRSHLANEIGEGGVQRVVVPVDYAENTRVLVDELRGQVPEIA